jgi:hypothetical protein
MTTLTFTRAALIGKLLIDMRAHYRLVLAAFAAIVWNASPVRAQQEGGAPVVQERLVARSRVIVNGALFEATTSELLPVDVDDPETARPKTHTRLSIVNFNSAVFGQSQSNAILDADQEHQRLAALLTTKISHIEELFGLKAAQKQKLELAGRGDLHRLFEKIEDLRQKCDALTEHDQRQNGMNLLLEWGRGISREIQPLKATLAQGPFGEDSLFSKTLAGMLSREQMAEYRRRDLAAAPQPARPVAGMRPAVPRAKADRDARLAAVLTEWERASSRIDRLDCQFLRFKYDRTFEVEWRATGSLAIEKSGRAMYRVTAGPIKPGEVSQKLTPTGAPYALKSETPERWHWTGNRVVKVNEKERTYEELIRDAKANRDEFEPEPPALPEEMIESPTHGAQSISGPRRSRNRHGLKARRFAN